MDLPHRKSETLAMARADGSLGSLLALDPQSQTWNRDFAGVVYETECDLRTFAAEIERALQDVCQSVLSHSTSLNGITRFPRQESSNFAATSRSRTTRFP